MRSRNAMTRASFPRSSSCYRTQSQKCDIPLRRQSITCRARRELRANDSIYNADAIGASFLTKVPVTEYLRCCYFHSEPDSPMKVEEMLCAGWQPCCSCSF